MKMKSPIAALALTAFAAAFSSSAQATDYVEVSSATADFYYDADFWGSSAVTLTGNTISFGLASDFSTSATARGSAGSYASDTQLDVDDQFSVYVVAHAGYALTSDLTHTVNATYSLTANGGQVSADYSMQLSSARSVNGSYAIDNELRFDIDIQQLSSNGASQSGAYVFGGLSTNYPQSGAQYAAVGINNVLGLQSLQNGPGKTASAFTSESFGFTVSAVPEPETYGMMLAGLGLIGFVARRRKGARVA